MRCIIEPGDRFQCLPQLPASRPQRPQAFGMNRNVEMNPPGGCIAKLDRRTQRQFSTEIRLSKDVTCLRPCDRLMQVAFFHVFRQSLARVRIFSGRFQFQRASDVQFVDPDSRVRQPSNRLWNVFKLNGLVADIETQS
jgi:hypothetical protein